MRIFYITISIILLLTASAKSQNHPNSTPLPDPDNKIVKFYPNPAISIITFDLQKKLDKTYSLQIYNFLGKKVYDATAVDQKTIINLSDFFRGIYIFQLKDQTGKIVESDKFQVAK
ncbi:MAG TPA: T9SS type A sorting domain-containing protein [Puia sp.]|nr:T9SS type A sorting domain-containing protein [Puia sp.]